MEERKLRHSKAKKVRNKIWTFYIDNGLLSKVKIWLFDRNDFDYTQCRFGGSYVFVSGEGDPLYVGKSNNLNGRLRNHLTYEDSTAIFMDFVQYIIIIKGGEWQEYDLIALLDPVFNISRGREDSHHGERFRFFKHHIMSKYPEYKEEFLKKFIQERRLEYNIKETVITKYNEGVASEEILDLLSIH